MSTTSTSLVGAKRKESVPRRKFWNLAWLLPVFAGPFWVLAFRGISESILGGLGGLVLVSALAVSAYTDVQARRIPNWVTYPAFVWALALNLVASAFPAWAGGSPWLGAVGLSDSLWGAAACVVPMFFLYSLVGGAGDVKLAAVIGALLGPTAGIQALLMSYLVGASVLVVWLIWKRGPLFLFRSFGRQIGSFCLPGRIAPPSDEDKKVLQTPIPLALFLAVGTLLSLSNLWIFESWLF